MRRKAGGGFSLLLGADGVFGHLEGVAEPDVLLLRAQRLAPMSSASAAESHCKIGFSNSKDGERSTLRMLSISLAWMSLFSCAVCAWSPFLPRTQHKELRHFGQHWCRTFGSGTRSYSYFQSCNTVSGYLGFELVSP